MGCETTTLRARPGRADAAHLEGAAQQSRDDVLPPAQDDARALAALLCAPLGTQNWRLAAGRVLRHTVYSLIGCPVVKAATYLLVRRHADGSCTVLAVRRTRSAAPSLNLAGIRRSGARLGANEVHLYQAARSDVERRRLVAELTELLLDKVR